MTIEYMRALSFLVVIHIILAPNIEIPRENYTSCYRTKLNNLRRLMIMKKRSTFGLVIDFILVLCTGGLWLIWILIRYLRSR